MTSNVRGSAQAGPQGCPDGFHDRYGLPCGPMCDPLDVCRDETAGGLATAVLDALRDLLATPVEEGNE